MMEKPCYTLMLNAAEGRLQCLLACQSEGNMPWEQVTFQEWHAPSQGAELLAPVLDSLLQRCRISAKQIQRIAAVRGPGGFTGIRLVLATAAGLARAVDAQLAGVDYLPLLADSLALQRQCWTSAAPVSSIDSTAALASCWVVTHARRNLVHAQHFVFAPHGEANGIINQAPAPLTVPTGKVQVFELQALVASIAATDGCSLLIGSGVDKNKTFIEEELFAAKANFAVMGANFSHPSAAALLRSSIDAIYEGQDIAPLYVRGSDAEENLAHIAQKLAIDPTAAQDILEQLTK